VPQFVLPDLRQRFGDDVHLHEVPARAAQITPIPEWVDNRVSEALHNLGIDSLWQHQASALASFHAGTNFVVATGTASGKSLCYQIPIAHTILTEKKSRALYIAPTKALAHDQVRAFHEWQLREISIATYDGDTDQLERRFAREQANVIVTNPDMLHHGMLSLHSSWASMFKNLRVIAIDECHLYRGVFGANVANVLKRLLRVAALYGSSPQVIMVSATVSSPAQHAHTLTGREFIEITEDFSPHGPVTVALALPSETLMSDIDGAKIRRSTTSEAADALTDLVVAGIRTLAFVRSRKAAETIARIARENLAEIDSSLISKVNSYRAGYLPEERREIELKLRTGELLGVATTSALELGVDISGLDAVVIAGWPGTRASFWQQVGRAGRDQQQALAMMIASDNPLDHYLVNHPESVIGQPVEHSVCDPTNANVLKWHLACAAAEQHLGEDELPLFGDSTSVRKLLDQLCSEGYLKLRATGWYWAATGRAHQLVAIRGSGANSYSIVETGTGRIAGTVDAAGAFLQVHPGAVYVHLGETYLVDELDIENHVAFISTSDVDYSTFARELTSVTLVEEVESKNTNGMTFSRGVVDVTEHVVAYQKRRNLTGQLLGEDPLDLPPTTLRTEGVWWVISPLALQEAGIKDIAGAAHAAEHAGIGLLPLFATCDRWDIGGVSMAEHPDTGGCTVVIYDGHPGGAGFAHHGFSVARSWLSATRDAVQECACTDGCPGCIQSPKCGNNNHPLDKKGAVTMLNLILQNLPPD